MKTLSIHIKEHAKDYPILIGENLLSQIDELLDLSGYSKVAIIADNHTKTFIPSLKSAIKQQIIEIIIPSGEKTKNIETVKEIWQHMTDAQLDRKSLVINLGGGVIGDMGGFAAATYMRGIAFIQIPTTLLSMVDASVGGKVGINFAEVKNSIGSFQQPIAVIIDTNTLETLPDREFNSGFAEIIKHGLIDDKNYFEHVTNKTPRSYSPEELVEIIEGSCKIKALIVQVDEHETNIRKTLNFGHTIGHAVEILSAQSETPLLHGEAISIGMVAEAKISELLGYIQQKDLERIEEAFMNAKLPTRITGISQDRIFEKILTDKKNSHGKVKWTLLQAIGKADYNIEIGETFIKKAIQYISA